MFTIVCLGDSITSNQDGSAYPEYWQELLVDKQITIKNAGVNGNTAADALKLLEKDVISQHPDLVTVMFGHNEVFLQNPVSTYQQNLKQIITRLNCLVWLLSPNQVWGKSNELAYQPYLDCLPQIAKKHKIKFIDVWLEAYKHQNLDFIYTYMFDGFDPPVRDYIHPNQKGQKLIANLLMETFKKSLQVTESIYV